MYKSVRLKAGISKVSVNNELRVLRRVLRWAHELGAIAQSPRIGFFKYARRRIAGSWTAAEVTRLLTEVRRVSPDIYPMVLFLATTGARRGEAIALPWTHVDIQKGLVRIWAVDPEASEGVVVERWSPKTMEREVPIPAAMLAYFGGARRSPTWVFPSAQTGGRFAFWPARKFDRARDAAGLKGGAHKLRHTYASHFLERNPNLFLLARVMGHSHVRVTELYSHLVPGYLDKARNVVAFDLPETDDEG
jgi:integrase